MSDDISTNNIAPALTLDQWKALSLDPRCKLGPTLTSNPVEGRRISVARAVDAVEPDVASNLYASEFHGVAALCLYDQPFGFTRRDVTRLRVLAHFSPSCSDLLDLANRIAALLPPVLTDRRIAELIRDNFCAPLVEGMRRQEGINGE